MTVVVRRLRYLPAWMRFNAPDSLSPFGAGGANPYAYCKDDPINRIDPNGHFNMAAFGDQLEEAVTRITKTSEDQPISVRESTGTRHNDHVSTSAQTGQIQIHGERTSTVDERHVWRTVWAEKKPVPVSFDVAKAPVLVNSIEGKNWADVGDYLLNDQWGREWHVKPNIFRQKYEILNPSAAVPKPIPVVARQLRVNFEVHTSWAKDGPLASMAGDYLLTDPSDPHNPWPVENKAFRDTYRE